MSGSAGAEKCNAPHGQSFQQRESDCPAAA